MKICNWTECKYMAPILIRPHHAQAHAFTFAKAITRLVGQGLCSKSRAATALYVVIRGSGSRAGFRVDA